MTTHAIVAISLYTAELYSNNKVHTRQQFPLMLAWAVTVYVQP